MELLALFGISLVGSVIWFVPVSATSAAYGQLGWHPLLVGLVASSAQTLGFCILYLGGEQAVRRWRPLARRIDETRERYLPRLEQAYLPSTALGGVSGMPPMVALATLAPAFNVRLHHFLAVAFAARLCRYSFLAAAGQSVGAWLGL
jgi:membrane protein YqaA with SNARE-associated domain